MKSSSKAEMEERIVQLERELNNALYKVNYLTRQKKKSDSELAKIKASNAWLWLQATRSMFSGWKGMKSFFTVTLRTVRALIAGRWRRAREEKRKLEAEAQSAKRHQSLLEQAAVLPKSNGQSYYQPLPVKVAIITDEFMFNYYKDAFDEIFWLTPSNYEQVFTQRDIRLFLYVSCWAGGNNDEWRGHTKDVELRAHFQKIFDICERKKIPTVFQTIEDPSNYDHFLPLARNFDVILTSDEDILQKYVEANPSKVCAYAEYGVNPLANNPIGSVRDKSGGFFFAGSYATRYPERCADMCVIFDAVISNKQDQVIADRNRALESLSYKFPEKYRSFLVDGFEHAKLQSVHKLFAVNINVNSIKLSSTMCAMRVYELQAQNTTLVSNYALSVSNRFPWIRMVLAADDLSQFIEHNQHFFFQEQRSQALRQILAEKSVVKQAAKVLAAAGVEVPSQSIRVALVEVATDHELDEQIVSDEIQIIKYSIDALSELSELSIGHCDYLVLINQHQYGAHYVQGMINAFKYVDVPYVTKDAYFEEGALVTGVQHDFTYGSPDPYRSMFRISQIDLSVLEQNQQMQFEEAGYSTDPFDLNAERFFENLYSRLIVEPLLSVIVPVYNNGRYLEARCFSSLMLQERFSEFEILLMDDGSTDEITESICQKLARRHPNVKYVQLEAPASGSASRPRNEGIKAATTEYITFLDPDNAICPKGYDHLLTLMGDNQKLDACFGYQLKVDGKATPTGRLFKGESPTFDLPKEEVLLALNFPTISTQAAIIRRSVLVDNEIDFILGAVGQDTTFGYEVLSVSKTVKFIDYVHIDYFADRPNSVTNQVGVNFFRKSLILEQHQKVRLLKHKLWTDYLERRSAGFVKGWYLPKIELVGASEYDEARGILEEIAEINEIDVADLLDTSNLAESA